MKNVFKFFGVISLVALIGFSLASCAKDAPDDDNDGTTGDNTTYEKNLEGTAYSAIRGPTATRWYAVLFKADWLDSDGNPIQPDSGSVTITITNGGVYDLPPENKSFTLTPEYNSVELTSFSTEYLPVEWKAATVTGGLEQREMASDSWVVFNVHP